MTALWIILGICFFLLVLLFCPVSVFVGFENEFQVMVRYLFVKIQVYPQVEKARKKKKQPEKNEKKEIAPSKSKIRGILEQKGLSGLMNLLRELASVVADAAKKWIAHMVIDRLYLEITVADEDAAQAAVLYGEVCAGVYTPMGILLNRLKCRQYHINIVPNFQKKKCEVQFRVRVHILLLFLLVPAVQALIRSLIILKNEKQITEN